MLCGPSSIEYDYEKEAMRISIWKYFAISFVCLLFYLFIYLFYYFFIYLFIYLFIFFFWGGGGGVLLTRVFSQIAKYASFIFDLGSTGGAVMRALASHRCSPGWIPRPGVTRSLLLVLVLVPKVFLRVLRFSSPHSL